MVLLRQTRDPIAYGNYAARPRLAGDESGCPSPVANHSKTSTATTRSVARGPQRLKLKISLGGANWLNRARNYEDGTVRRMEEPQAPIELYEGRWWVVPSRILVVAQWGFGVSAVVAVICVIALRHSSGSGSPGSIGVGVAMMGLATAVSLLWALALGGAGWLLTGRERRATQYRRRGAVVGVLGIVSCWG